MAGFNNDSRQSFPSGHTTAAFAFAGALHRELRASQPRAARWVVPALYTAAALTGVARMHADKHWASDVVMGAGVGVVSSHIVARFHGERTAHWLDRLLPRERR
jgi:membrane-associated phospholipid phosphatase